MVTHQLFESRRPFRAARSLLIAIGALAAGIGTAAADNPGDEESWGAVSVPSAGPTQVIGTYSNGCVAGAAALPLDGDQ